MSLSDKAIHVEADYPAYFSKGDKALWTIFPHLCKGCGLCVEKCPVRTLAWSAQLGALGTPTPRIQEDIPCIACGRCQVVCPDCAITVKKRPSPKDSHPSATASEVKREVYF